MAKVKSNQNIEKHVIYFISDNYGHFWDTLKIKFDGYDVGEAHCNSEDKILFLERFNLKEHGLDGKGFGRVIIKALEEKFIEDFEKPSIFFVQFDAFTKSDLFYKKCGFKDFEKSKEFSEDKKSYI